MKLVVLDRDGVINHDSDDYIKSTDEWQPIDGSLDAVARLCRAGFTVAVVSNQSGFARGLFDRETLDAMHRKMHREVAAAGGEIAGVFVCPHAPSDGCACRKPAVGLLRQLEADLGTSVEGVPLIGDKPSDLDLARNAGCRPILVRTGKGRETERTASLEGVTVFDDLGAAVDHLVR